MAWQLTIDNAQLTIDNSKNYDFSIFNSQFSTQKPLQLQLLQLFFEG